VVGLLHSRLISSCLLLILAAGCRAQVPSNAPSAPLGNPAIDRRIEVLIRSQFSVPSDYDVLLGARAKSDFPGYETLPVTFSHHGKQTVINFLVSQDGNTLARLEKFDISKDPASSINVANRPVRGDAAAKVEIINFDDLECPFCARMNNELATATLDHYKGLVKIVYKDYPLQEIHPWAMHAAVDANCLAEQNSSAYWDDVDYVHTHGQDISGADHKPAESFTALDNIADTIGKRSNLDTAKLDACIKKQDESVVTSSVKLGTTLGIEGTPQVFVAGERLAGGARPLQELWAAIDRALKAEGIQPPPGAPPADSDGPATAPGK
jgi:protein-disulfide isomerase